MNVAGGESSRRRANASAFNQKEDRGVFPVMEFSPLGCRCIKLENKRDVNLSGDSILPSKLFRPFPINYRDKKNPTIPLNVLDLIHSTHVSTNPLSN
ncbi:hypothetical protein CEXT_551661 [Caerostris extrusa]|uniref:Uncharacterized protein n=1 Tax=Caerostris extrusa TaxID=172846 RepID=A0AAV4SWY9_CAEEX|nr:hypothetical protein CEXT_551661 [Caerostris extrusa]